MATLCELRGILCLSLMLHKAACEAVMTQRIVALPIVVRCSRCSKYVYYLYSHGFCQQHSFVALYYFLDVIKLCYCEAK